MLRPGLRPYQIDDLKRIDAAFAAGVRRVCYQAPTGTGKTVVFAEHIKREVGRGGRAVVLGHRDEIVQQVSGALRRLELPHGLIVPDQQETRDRVQVASVMTLARRLHRLRATPSLVVIDEAHHAVAASWLKIISALDAARILGVTATPRRLDGKPLNDVFETLIIGPLIPDLIDAGYLSPVTVFTPSHSPDLSRVAIRAGDYAVDQLATVMSKGIIVRGAVEEYERLCPGVSAICFCVDIAHSKLVAEAFRVAGYRAEHVDGETPRDQRRALIAGLQNCSIDILCNCGLISEGLDVPGVVAAILLRPTRSLALYLQMVGRALRPGKPLAYVLDHAGNVYRHGLPTARRRWSLRGKLQHDEDAEHLCRCPECGAVNPPRAEFCVHCGAVMHHELGPNIEIASPPLVEAIETPVDDDDLAAMGYRAMLRWAANDDGILDRARLERVAHVRRYQPGWVFHNAGRHWEEIWASTRQWRRQLGR